LTSNNNIFSPPSDPATKTIRSRCIFRYAKEGTLEIDGLKKIAATCDVATEGVGGAKTFFEAKAKAVSLSVS